MVKIIWTNTALLHLKAIYDYIAINSSKFATITVNKIHVKVNGLSSYPKMGRIVPEVNQEKIRELIEGNFRIIYEINTNNEVIILTIHHSSRELKR